MEIKVTCMFFLSSSSASEHHRHCWFEPEDDCLDLFGLYSAQLKWMLPLTRSPFYSICKWSCSSCATTWGHCSLLSRALVAQPPLKKGGRGSRKNRKCLSRSREVCSFTTWYLTMVRNHVLPFLSKFVSIKALWKCSSSCEVAHFLSRWVQK